MDHAKHRAQTRSAARWGAAGLVGGALVGAAIVLGVWVVIDGPPWQSEGGGATSAQPTTSPRIEARASREDRAQRATPPPQIRAAPTSAAATSDAPTTPVHLLGDSLAVGIAGYLEAGLNEQTLTTDAAEGRGTATMVSLLAPYAASSAPMWVVSLGTNDNPEEFPDQAETIMELAGSERCVVWFDVWRVDTDEAINAALEQLAAEHANLHIVEWHDTSAVHPEWFSGTDVHPSTTGYAVRGQLAVDAIDRGCGSSS